MRTTKRFAPDVLDRFRRLGRGTGTYEEYVSWHSVTRGDPASRGRSHIVMSEQRSRDLLSDLEYDGFRFSSMLPHLTDSRENYPLVHEPAPHELSAYDRTAIRKNYPGTLSIAAELGVKHPMIHGNGRSALWVITTDQLLTLCPRHGHRELLAVAYKYPEEQDKTRTKELLAIEQLYWVQRDVPWLLMTPDLFDSRVALTLRNTQPWGLGRKADESAIRAAMELALELNGFPLCRVFDRLKAHFGDMDLAQRAFWQAVWRGAIPLDLRRGWRPHEPIRLLSEEAFWDLNPLAARRSAWI